MIIFLISAGTLSSDLAYSERTSPPPHRISTNGFAVCLPAPRDSFDRPLALPACIPGRNFAQRFARIADFFHLAAGWVSDALAALETRRWFWASLNIAPVCVSLAPIRRRPRIQGPRFPIVILLLILLFVLVIIL